MRSLSIDIETYSTVDLTRSTVYRYSEAADFQVLLFGYAFDDSDVEVIDLTQERFPKFLKDALQDPEIIKCAFNANFERVCLSRMLGIDGFLPPEQWRCTMVQALSLGLPRSLADVGAALGLPEDQAKLKTGKNLIRYFSVPCKPTKANGGRTRNTLSDDPEKWRMYIEYNRRDVETERVIRKRLSGYPLSDAEQAAWCLDQRINDRGVLCDRKLVAGAIDIAGDHTEELVREAYEITGLDNVNSVAQLKKWLGIDGSLDKKAIKAMRDGGQLGAKEDRLLEIRQELGKTSISKYEAMERGMCSDDRIRGILQFYGASRTGRWAGRQVQIQNLPQNHISDLDTARQIAIDKDRDGMQLLYGNVPDTLSQLIRTAFIAKPGYTFAVADFSAIEARVLAWMAGEQWRMDVFRNGGDIYCASASQMFKVPVVKHGVNGHLRQKGKIAELALGYGGSVGALKAMGALEMGLEESELQPLVDMWRKTNPQVTGFWWDVDRMVREAIMHPGSQNSILCGRTELKAVCTRKMLQITLPSGRKISYWEPALEIKDGRENITYAGTDAGKWSRLETYGPKLVENIVQATSRDCLRDAMTRVARCYPSIVMHVHDEMIVEVPEAEAEKALGYMEDCMGRELPWAPGLLLRGDGYITDYYRKD